MRRLLFSCPARPDAEGRFRRAVGVPVRPVHPLATAALTRLSGAWPRRLSFTELLDACGAGETTPTTSAKFCWAATRPASSKRISMRRISPPNRAIRPIQPARAHAVREENVAVNLYHTLVQIPDETVSA